DEVAAAVEIGLEHLLGFLDAAARAARVFAERHRAERERADPKPRAAQGEVVIEWHESAPGCWDVRFHEIPNQQLDGRSIPLRSCTILLYLRGLFIRCGCLDGCARPPTFSTRCVSVSLPTPGPISRPRSTGSCCPTPRRHRPSPSTRTPIRCWWSWPRA